MQLIALYFSVSFMMLFFKFGDPLVSPSKRFNEVLGKHFDFSRLHRIVKSDPANQLWKKLKLLIHDKFNGTGRGKIQIVKTSGKDKLGDFHAHNTEIQRGNCNLYAQNRTKGFSVINKPLRSGAIRKFQMVFYSKSRIHCYVVENKMKTCKAFAIELSGGVNFRHLVLLVESRESCDINFKVFIYTTPGY